MTDRTTEKISAADEAQMALCHLDWIGYLPGVHPHRVSVIRKALERLALTDGEQAHKAKE